MFENTFSTKNICLNKVMFIKLINVYVPNGNPIGTEKYEYKKDWYNSFIKK